jgi:hypothetical protein
MLTQSMYDYTTSMYKLSSIVQTNDRLVAYEATLVSVVVVMAKSRVGLEGGEVSLRSTFVL